MSELVNTSSNTSLAGMQLFLKSLKFIVVSYVISFVFLAILAAVVVYTDVPYSISEPAVKLITLFAAFLSALMSAKSITSRGWLWGAVTGTLNVFILCLGGSILMKLELFSASNLSLMGCGALFGIVGGILGVNIGNK